MSAINVTQVQVLVSGVCARVMSFVRARDARARGGVDAGRLARRDA